MKKKLRVLSLFSGIGAFEQALKNLDIETEIVNYCEIDKYASKSYNILHDVPEALNLGDITQIDLSNLPSNIDLLTHGSPCQSFSIAGKQGGGDEGTNTRSSLMWNSVAIIRIIKPKYVIWENVKNVLSVKHKHNFDKYLDTMSEMGYTNHYKVLNAKNYGVPQNRERIICVSILDATEEDTFKFPEPFDNGIRLIHMLEPEVDEKFYLNSVAAKNLIADYTGTTPKIGNNIRSREFECQGWKDLCPTLCARDYKDPKTIILPNIKVAGSLGGKHEQSSRVYDSKGIAPTICAGNRQTSQGGITVTKVIASEQEIKQIGLLDINDLDKQRRVYNPTGIAPCLTARSDSPKIIQEDTHKVFTEDVPQMVRVRTHDVDIEKLKVVLKESKKESKFSIQEIADTLDVPKTNVEHWFRTDKYFSIPEPELWLQLKFLLGIDTDEFDESIMTFEVREGVYDKANRCYHIKGVAPTLTASVTAERILIPEQEKELYRIRKITPRETWRLMGFGDKCFDMVDGIISNTQLYKQAGNSIVVPMLECVYKELFHIED